MVSSSIQKKSNQIYISLLTSVHQWREMRAFILLPLLFTALLQPNIFAKCETPLKAGYELYPPFFYTNEKNELITGFDFEFAKLIEKEINCPIIFSYRPWKRLLKETQSGENHLIFSSYATPERLMWSESSIKYVDVHSNIYINKNFKKKYKIKTKEDLYKYQSQISIGLVDGWTYGIESQKWQKHFRSQSKLPNDKTVIKLIQLNRLQAAVLNTESADEYISSSGKFDQVASFEGYIDHSQSDILISKKTNPLLRHKIQKAVKKIIKKKEFKSLLKKYKLSLSLN